MRARPGTTSLTRGQIAGRTGASSTSKHFASQAVSGIRVELETVHRSDGPSEYAGDYDPTRSEKQVRVVDSAPHRNEFDKLGV